MPEWVPPDSFPRLDGATVALDLETKDSEIEFRGAGWANPDPESGYIVGVGLATREWRGYWPVRHAEGGNIDRGAVWRWLSGELPKAGRVVTHNGLYDTGWMEREGLPVPDRIEDTQAMCALVFEYEYAYNLEAMGQKYLGVGKDETKLRAEIARRNMMIVKPPRMPYDPDPIVKKQQQKERAARSRALRWDAKADLWRLPASMVGEYGEFDPWLTLQLFDTLEPLMARDDLQRVYDLEMDLIPVLRAARRRGVRIDIDAIERVRPVMIAREREIYKELKALTGFSIDSVWNSDELARMFDAAGVEYPLTAKTRKPSFKAEWLRDLPGDLGRLIGECRVSEKTRNTFLDALRNLSYNGRLYPEFISLPSDEGGAVTGRMSSRHPNAQNLPSRNKKIKKLVRSMFLPDEGALWCASDYSQQEFRLVAHFASVAGVHGSHDVISLYNDKPDIDFHQMVADMTGVIRDYAKIINFGLVYGMGGAKLCRSLGLPTIWKELPDRDPSAKPGAMVQVEFAGEEGQAILDTYHARVPFIRALSQECARRAKRRDYIRTIGGRLCRFGNVGRKAFPYMAMNRLIQGSAADQLKAAAIAAHRAGAKLHLFVHDEMDSSVSGPGEAKVIAECMRDVIKLRVPVLVDTELGPSWGQVA